MKRLIKMTVFTAMLAQQVSAAVLTIPGDYATIQSAIDNAPDGSTIEVSAGTYNEYITALDVSKDLYFMANSGATNTFISGGGIQKLLYVANGVNGDSEKNIVFDGFTFRDGYEAGSAQSPITISDAKTVFLNCVFENNRAAEKGGALLVYGSLAHPKFLNCTFSNNFSQQTAGAALINGNHCSVTFKECNFVNNSNRWVGATAGDNGGGAIYFSVAGGYILDCLFKSNSCSYAGGAVTSITPFDDVEDFIYIEDTVFDGNIAAPLPGVSAPANTEAGAVFSEGNVLVEFNRCFFTNNVAEGGGAIQSYRAKFNVYNSVFVNNRASGGLGTGGAISMGLDDSGDTDRREAGLLISNVLIRGCSGHAGGGLYHASDQSNGHQGTVTVHRLVVDGCSSTKTGLYDGHGGGIYLQNSIMNANELYVLNNTAEGGGGGITLVLDTDISGQNCYFVGNEATGGNHAVYDPQGNSPSWNTSYFGHNPPGSGGTTTNWLAGIMDYTVEGLAHLTYAVVPDGGSPSLSPGAVTLPDNGSYRAGSLSLTGQLEDTTYTLTSSLPAVTADIGYAAFTPAASLSLPPVSVPGWIEAENYDVGGEGSAYHDSSVGNAGTSYRTGENVEIAALGSASNGHLVGWIVAGEWLEYSISAAVSGTYDIHIRVASDSDAGKFYMQIDGKMLGAVRNVQDTGGWSSWDTVTIPDVDIKEGWHKVRIISAASGYNLDGFSFILQGTNPVLSVSSETVRFQARKGVTPWSKAIEVWNSGAQVLHYEIQSSNAWLSVSPTNGTSTGERDSIFISVDIAAMATGSISGTLVIQSDATNDSKTVTVNVDIIPDRPHTTDFDGDGKADLAIFRPTNSTWYVIHSSDSQEVSYVWGLLDSDIPVAGDYDADGIADHAAYQNNGTWHIARSAAGYTGLQLGAPGVVNVPADYDGDGATDLAVYEPWSGVWHVSASSVGYFGIGWGGSTDIPVPADYDGDGKDDIAIYRTTDNTWHIICSSNGVKVETWGLLSTDEPVPADYDGDGIADLAVYQANGTWHVARSSAGYAGLQLGSSSDIPVPADYDGDGAADLAIFEPNGTWHISQSSEGYIGVIFGQSGDLPIRVKPQYDD